MPLTPQRLKILISKELHSKLAGKWPREHDVNQAPQHEGMHRLNVLRFRRWKAFQQHLIRPSIGQSALDMFHGQARSLNERFATKDGLVACDVLLPIHAPKLLLAVHRSDTYRTCPALAVSVRSTLA